MTASRQQLRRQIGFDPLSRREPRATAAQLDLLASLLERGIAQNVIRWDTTTQEAMTVRRASMLINSVRSAIECSMN